MNLVDRENKAVLALVEAMVGAISSNVRRVSLAIADDTILLQFVLLSESDNDREEIADIEFVFESLYEHSIQVSIEIVVTMKPLSEVMSLHRIVFAQRST